MKYIRTKDGRIIDLDRIVYGNKVFHLNENEIENDSWSGWYWYTEEYGYELECRDLDILKQADNIEELCDEFIWKWNKNEFPYSTARQYIRLGYGDLKREIRNQLVYGKTLNVDYQVYGVIWVILDNSAPKLEPVAKMNDKGKLELL